jgi:hypothetical protein
MPSLNEIRHYELDPGVCVAHRNRSSSRIILAAGTLWLTLEGTAADYWLRPGDSLAIAPGQRIWLSAETHTARFRITRELRPTLSSTGKIRQTGRLAGDHTGMITLKSCC